MCPPATTVVVQRRSLVHTIYHSWVSWWRAKECHSLRLSYQGENSQLSHFHISRSTDSERRLELEQKYVMVDSIKCGTQAKEIQKCHLTRICHIKYVRQNFNKRWLGQVVSTISRLEWRHQVCVVTLLCNLIGYNILSFTFDRIVKFEICRQFLGSSGSDPGFFTTVVTTAVFCELGIDILLAERRYTGPRWNVEWRRIPRVAWTSVAEPERSSLLVT